jgi:hypothetical protein
LIPVRSLRELIPEIEIDWLLPAWLFLAISTAAVAEIWTIGVAVDRVYALPTGWAVGGVVASAQAIGSMIWARALQHNAGRYVRYKSVGPKENRRRVEDRANSEPRLNVWGPATVSLLAGTISAWLGIALYGADGTTTGLDVALAVASPAGSVASAALNGVFAYGESALSEWRESRTERGQSKRRSVRTERKGERPPTADSANSATNENSSDSAKVEPIVANEDKPELSVDLDDALSQAVAGKLVDLRERFHVEQQAGRINATFRRSDVEDWLTISKSYALSVINFGLERRILEKAQGHTYRFIRS